MWLGGVTPFVPLTFEKEISYLQMVQVLINRVNDLSEFVNSLVDNVNDHTDREIAKLKADFDKQVKEIYKTMGENYTSLTDLIGTTKKDLLSYIDREVTKLIERIEKNYYELIKIFKHGDNVVTLETDLKIAKLKSEIDSVNEDGFRIFNPTIGKISKVAETVNDVYNVLRYALKASEYTTIPFYIKDFDEEYTCIRFDTFNKWDMLMYDHYLINSPKTGLKISHEAAISELWQNLQGGSYTVEIVDSKNLVVNDVDSANWTAYRFDFHNMLLF